MLIKAYDKFMTVEVGIHAFSSRSSFVVYIENHEFNASILSFKHTKREAT